MNQYKLDPLMVTKKKNNIKLKECDTSTKIGNLYEEIKKEQEFEKQNFKKTILSLNELKKQHLDDKKKVKKDLLNLRNKFNKMNKIIAIQTIINIILFTLTGVILIWKMI